MAHTRGIGWLVLAGITWGTSGTLGVFLRGTSGLGLLAAGGYRILVGGLLIAALVVLTGSPPEGLAASEALAGAGLACVAGGCFAAISLLGANPDADFGDATGTGIAFIGGGVLALGVAATLGSITFQPSPTSLALLVALGLVPSAIAYLAYLRGLRTESGTTGSLVALLEPVTATLLALAVLGEALTPNAALGGALLLGAVALTALGGGSTGTASPERMDPELHP